MKLDKNRSIKNKIGVLACTALLSLPFCNNIALAQDANVNSVESDEVSIETYIGIASLFGLGVFELNSYMLSDLKREKKEILQKNQRESDFIFDDKLIERKFNSINELADDITRQYEENPFLFHKGIIRIMPSDDNSLKELEDRLLKKIPNLIITHSDTDTSEDIAYQVERINQILDRNEAPYFIDFSKRKVEKTKINSIGH